MVNTQLFSPKGEDIWLSSQNAGVKHKFTTWYSIATCWARLHPYPKTIMFVIPDVSPLKHWTLLLDHKTHPCE